MIDPNKTYRTRDGRPVRVYATDGRGVRGYHHVIHGAVFDGGWVANSWNHTGNCETPEWNLVEVTLADELRDQIPWEALRPEIRWVAMDDLGSWSGHDKEPFPYKPAGDWAERMWMQDGGRIYQLDVIQMPHVRESRWTETLIERPEGR